MPGLRQRCIPRLGVTEELRLTARPLQAQLSLETLRLIKPVALLHDYHGILNVQECARPQLNVPYEE
ncbi:hypothetical protein WISP_16544 [Willisornis vidua]|uniref:Uncharacterized protein n=1 Tax=Willisornis vidua TaxID=1566151 RepID=A0ABQ9DUE7_9PASS|nr:hypothetical protein WISP_16544 [Willisornis vidua]